MNSLSNSPMRRPLARGFTLVELLTVIFIVGIVAGFTLPTLGRILDSSKVSAGVNTLVTAVATTRLVATSRQPPIGRSTASGYSGTALIVTPPSVGDLRITENDLMAMNGANGLLAEIGDGLNGYRDIEGLDFVSQPSGTRLVGINRIDGELEFLEPPFAIRFDENGQLGVGSRAFGVGENSAQATLLVHYDSNINGSFGASTRPANFDPASFTPTFDADAEKNTAGPFERLETVAGVRVLRINDDAENPADDFADVFFSRVTGAPIITRRPGSQQ